MTIIIYIDYLDRKNPKIIDIDTHIKGEVDFNEVIAKSYRLKTFWWRELSYL